MDAVMYQINRRQVSIYTAYQRQYLVGLHLSQALLDLHTGLVHLMSTYSISISHHHHHIIIVIIITTTRIIIIIIIITITITIIIILIIITSSIFDWEARSTLSC